MDFLSSFDFEKPLSLYIHIPFCLSKCSYCAFYSCSGVGDEEKEAYTKCLVNEIEAVTSNMKTPFYTAFIGGGNPFCLSPSQLERICTAVCKNGQPKEFTCEMNPESINNSYFDLFSGLLNRASMGVQSLDEKALKFLGRNATLKETVSGIESVLRLREEKKTRISFDLITCLGSFHNSLLDVQKMVENYQPEHLSVYSLSLEEGTPLYKRGPILPNSDEQYKILSDIWDYLENQGFEHYEVSNFAKKGNKSLHNSVYWAYKPYIGLGSAGASTSCKNGVYFRHNCDCDFHKYITGKEFSCYSSEQLTREQSAEELVMLGLRHSEGLNLERLEKEFGYRVNTDVFGFIEKDNRLIPQKSGFMTADAAAVRLTGHFIVC